MRTIWDCQAEGPPGPKEAPGNAGAKFLGGDRKGTIAVKFRWRPTAQSAAEPCRSPSRRRGWITLERLRVPVTLQKRRHCNLHIAGHKSKSRLI